MDRKTRFWYFLQKSSLRCFQVPKLYLLMEPLRVCQNFLCNFTRCSYLGQVMLMLCALLPDNKFNIYERFFRLLQQFIIESEINFLSLTHYFNCIYILIIEIKLIYQRLYRFNYGKQKLCSK